MKTTALISAALLTLTPAVFSLMSSGAEGQSPPVALLAEGPPEYADTPESDSEIRFDGASLPESDPTRFRVALQAGHWKASEAPDELASLRSNGTRGGGKHEWEVTLEIAERTARLLEEAGFQVDVLPATVPPGYRADLFIAIHADGHASTTASGFTVGAPRRDATGRAEEFARVLEQAYREATNLRQREVTRRMQGYYAFNSRRYHHAIHPETVGVIIETGFLTSPSDRNIIVNDPDRSARGIAEAVARYLTPASDPAAPRVVAR